MPPLNPTTVSLRDWFNVNPQPHALNPATSTPPGPRLQGIAADPEAFFALQRSAPLLQPQQPAEPLSAVAAAAGGGGRASGGAPGGPRMSGMGGAGGLGRNGGGAGGNRASVISTVGGRERRRSSGSGDESTALLEGADGGERAGAGGRGRGRRSTMTTAEEMVPDCFLCPLTCRVSRGGAGGAGVSAGAVCRVRFALCGNATPCCANARTSAPLCVAYPASAAPLHTGCSFSLRRYCFLTGLVQT